MATTVDNSWIPVSGRHSVSIGPSLGRALKGRKGGPLPKNNRVPNVDFFSLRYNFQPESIDSSKPGTIDVRRGRESTSVTVERACTQNDDGGHVFVGTEQVAREWDCVLVYNEETGTFTLEKLDSYVNLTYDRKADHAPCHPGSPAAVPPPPGRISASTSTSTQVSSRAQSKATPAEEEEPGTEDAEGDLDEEFAQLLPPSPVTKTREASRPTAAGTSSNVKPNGKMPAFGKIKKDIPEKEEGEASEGEIIEEKPRPVPRPTIQTKAKPSPVILRPPPKTTSKASTSAKPSPKPPTPKPRVPLPTAAKPSPPTAKPSPIKPLPASSLPTASSVNANNKRPLEPEVEVFEIGRPAQPPAKRARTPPRAKSPGLALPGAGIALSLPSSTSIGLSLPSGTSSGLSFPGSSAVAVSLPPPAPAVDSDEDEEWDEVQPAAQPAPRAIVMEEIVPETTPRPIEEPDADGDEEDAGWGDFEEEMKLVDPADADAEDGAAAGDDDEDFLAAAISPVTEKPPYPIAGESDDEYTSSDDDSDDD